MTLEAAVDLALARRSFVRHLCIAAGLNSDDADDALQRLALQAARYHRSIRPEQAVAWLNVSARNLVRNIVAERHRHDRPESDCEDGVRLHCREFGHKSTPSAETVALARFEALTILGPGTTLRPAHVSALRLATLGLTDVQIAAREGVPRGTIASRLHSARKRIREEGAA